MSRRRDPAGADDEALRIAQQAAERMYAADTAVRAFGISVTVSVPGEAVARMPVREDMLNGFDVCHGGLVFALADTAFAYACNGHGRLSLAASASIEFLRPVRLGDELTATAREDYRGRRSGFHTVTVENRRGELVALFRGRSASPGEPVAPAKSDTNNIEKPEKP